MVPQPTRRRYLVGLSLASTATLAGCIGSPPGSQDDSTTDGTTAATTEESTTEGTTESEGAPSRAESPAAAFRKYITATLDDPAAARHYFHPLHPFGPEKLSADEARELFGRAEQPRDISLEAGKQELSAEAIHQRSALRHTDVERETVAAAIEGEETAVVEADVTQADGETESNRLATATHDDGWVILSQAFQPETTPANTGPFETRVVEAVTFDTEDDTARVEFVDGPVADEVTVTATEAFSERSTTTPKPIDYFSLQVAPDGDTVIVTATIDERTREIHREQYPPVERLVEDVTYDDPDSDGRDATARVLFTDDVDGERNTVTVEATISGDEATFEPGNSEDDAVARIDPAGDEIVVSRTVDGDATVVHRERYHP